MRLRKTIALLTTTILAGLVAGCERSPAPVAVERATPAARDAGIFGADELVALANDLGQSELRRMAAAEMVYRNHVMQHTVESGLTVEHIYMKCYRQFKDFSIIDIRQTGSLYHPVEYTIQYNFDMLGTVGEHATMRDLGSMREAARDYRFVKQLEDSLRRTYKSETSGRPIQSYSPVLERLNYWQYRASDLLGQRWRLEDVTSLAYAADPS
jgi:hypothetical protein